MKLPTFKFTLLPIACLSGLVSCYPLTPYYQNPNVPAPRPSGLMTPAELKEAAQEKADAANSEETALQRSKERLEREENRRLEAEKKEAQAYRNKANNNTTIFDRPKLPEVKPPAVIKFAAPVPGKAGFVYNPFTQNEVDVRGIPSGTKVRDPHDSNNAHIFKVP